MEDVLTVKGLTKTYGAVTAVENLSLNVRRGEVFGLLGHNGAGKSTSIACMLGVLKADRGDVRLLGMDPVKDRKRLFQRVGVQFQQIRYPEKLKVGELCRVTASLYRETTPWEELLADFGLDGFQKRTVTDLSGGEQQRLNVLLALIPKPELVFLDELTTGLDAKARRDVWKHLAGLKQRGLSMVLTSHYMDEVQMLCDRACILKQGRTIALDTIEALIDKSPCDTMEDAYLWYTGEEEPA